jgi:hypothetical protein
MVMVALGCASLAAACIGSAEDEVSPAPITQSASAASEAAAPAAPGARIAAQVATPRVARFARETQGLPTTGPETQDWKPELGARIETAQEERATFEPAALAAMQDLRVWMGGEK